MIKPVYLEYHQQKAFKGMPENMRSSRFARRMSPLQLAVCSVFRSSPYSSSNGSVKLGTDPILVSSPFGEFAANVKLSNSIVKKQFPLSPATFQNSVYNAAGAYLTINEKINCEVISIGRGFLSLDMSLMLAHRLVSCGANERAIVISGSDTGCDDGAHVTMIVLSAQASRSSIELDSIEQQSVDQSSIFPDDAVHEHVDPFFCQFSVNIKVEKQERYVIAKNGQMIKSIWKSV